MRHLDEAEFVDLIDGRLEPSLAWHVDECDACRSRAASLRDVLGDVQADEGPEPSPLFWTQFASRVSAAVRDEAPVPAPPAWLGWMRTPATTWAVAASIAVLLMVAAVWRATLPAVPADQSAIATAPLAAPGADDVEGDREWAIVRTAASDLAWDDVTAAGITAHPGSAEDVVMELTADERTELARLLKSEMRDNGAS